MTDRPSPSPFDAFLALRQRLGPVSDPEVGYLAKRPFESTTCNPPTGPASSLPDDIPLGTGPASSAPIGALEAARERMQQLERALGEAIDYLERLPKHPETSRVRDALGQALSGSGIPVSRRPLVGESHYPSGAPMLEVELHGQDLYITAHATLHEEERKLVELLRRGEHLVRLAAPVSHVLSELEARYAERRSGRIP